MTAACAVVPEVGVFENSLDLLKAGSKFIGMLSHGAAMMAEADDGWCAFAVRLV